MELQAAIETRSSVRSFSTEPVATEHLRQMVRLAGTAPSVNNSQPWRYVAVTNSELKRRMAQAVNDQLDAMMDVLQQHLSADGIATLRDNCTLFAQAAAVVVAAWRHYEALLDHVLAHNALTHEEAHALRGYPDVVSLGASVQNLMLAATDLGYGTCWLTGPLVARPRLEALLHISSPWRIGAIIAVGKPALPTQQSAKKPVDDIFELLT